MKHTRPGLVFTGILLPTPLVLLVVSICVLPLQATAASGSPGETPSMEQLLERADKAIGQPRQYSYVLKKRDRLTPKDELSEEETLFVKFRKPYEIYLKTTDGPNKGREVLYAKGRYGDKILGHEPWMRWPLSSVSVNPVGVQAMKYTHRPITEAEIGFCVRVLKESMAKDTLLRRTEPGYEPMRVEGPKEVVDNGVPLYYFKVMPPERWLSYTATDQDETLFDVADKMGVLVNCLIYYNDGVDHIKDFSPGTELRAPTYCGKVGEFWLYRDTFLLHRQRITDWYGNIYEDYTHTDIKVDKDASLSDKDFDKKNKEYNF